MGYGVNEIMVPTGSAGLGGAGGGFAGGLTGGIIASILPGLYRGGFGGYGGGEGAVSVQNAINTDSILDNQAMIAKSIPEQTVQLMQDTHRDELATAQGFLGVQQSMCAEGRHFDTRLAEVAAEAAACCCNTQKELIAMGKDNEIMTLKTAAGLQQNMDNHAVQCLRDSHAVELRDLKGQNEIMNRIQALECMIKDTSLTNKLEAVERENVALRSNFQTHEILDCFGNLMTRLNVGINQLGVNDKFINPTVVWPPYNPTLTCGIGG